jgi:hypothetical protein
MTVGQVRDFFVPRCLAVAGLPPAEDAPAKAGAARKGGRRAAA